MQASKQESIRAGKHTRKQALASFPPLGFYFENFLITSLYNRVDMTSVAHEHDVLLRGKKYSSVTILLNKKECYVTITGHSFLPFSFQVNFALDLSIPLSKASSLLGYISIASCIGRIILGKIADHPRVNRLYLVQFSLTVVSICHTLVPLANTYWLLIIYCFICGALEGCFFSLMPVVAGDIVGKENLHNAIGAIYLLSSTFLMFGPPLAGKSKISSSKFFMWCYM